MDDKHSELFNAYYFAHDCGEPYLRNDVWLSRFEVFAERISLDIQPATVLDAGCAIGLLVEVLRKRGIEAWGIDISEYAIHNVHPDIRDYCQVGSITQPFPLPHYDLIVTIEVLEHLPKQDADKAIANLCQHSDDIIFSSTPYDYQEATHFNVQPTEYWVECFARQGFFRDVDFDASFITPWAIRFCREKMTLTRLARNYERALMPLLSGNTALRHEVINNRDQLAHNERHITGLELSNQELTQQLSEILAKLHLIEADKAELESKNNSLHSQLSSTEARMEDLLSEAQLRQDAADKRIIQLQQEKQDLALQLLGVQAQLDSIQQRRLYKIYRALRHPFK